MDIGLDTKERAAVYYVSIFPIATPVTEIFDSGEEHLRYPDGVYKEISEGNLGCLETFAMWALRGPVLGRRDDEHQSSSRRPTVLPPEDEDSP
jgi:hypothetical protein